MRPRKKRRDQGGEPSSEPSSNSHAIRAKHLSPTVSLFFGRPPVWAPVCAGLVCVFFFSSKGPFLPPSPAGRCSPFQCLTMGENKLNITLFSFYVAVSHLLLLLYEPTRCAFRGNVLRLRRYVARPLFTNVLQVAQSDRCGEEASDNATAKVVG